MQSKGLRSCLGSRNPDAYNPAAMLGAGDHPGTRHKHRTLHACCACLPWTLQPSNPATLQMHAGDHPGARHQHGALHACGACLRPPPALERAAQRPCRPPQALIVYLRYCLVMSRTPKGNQKQHHNNFRYTTSTPCHIMPLRPPNSAPAQRPCRPPQDLGFQRAVLEPQYGGHQTAVITEKNSRPDKVLQIFGALPLCPLR